MDIRTIIFDLDDTLADPGKGMSWESVEKIRVLEEKGIRIALCSGKPTHYLCGFLRMVGLKAPIMIGENGAVIQEYVDLPPRFFYVLPYDHEVQKIFAAIKQEIDAVLPQMWYQPNVVAFTPFPKNEKEFELVGEILKRHEAELSEQVEVFRHYDCFDLVPKGLNKAGGLKAFGELFGFAPDEMAAVGNGSNDYPMFAYVGYRVGVNVPEAERVDRNFATIEEALDHLLSITN